jgi:uncharacterized membrane protein YedE/YeeE
MILALFAALFAGGLFAVGLAVGGMTMPSKVVGFLDITGNWDPSLAFVMGGALLVYAPIHRLVLKMQKPLGEPLFRMPTRRDINPRLLIGAAIFGAGWGLAGYCPGPALTSLGSLAESAIYFVPAMFVGFALVNVYDRLTAKKS